MVFKTLTEIAQLVDGVVAGENVEIIGLNGIKEASPGDLTFLADRKYLPLIAKTHASAVVVAEDHAEALPLPAIRVKDPVSAFSRIVEEFVKTSRYVERGIHPTAVIGDEVHIEQGVSIGARTVIHKGARIGRGTVIHAGCFIGAGTVIGADCEIYPNVVIREKIIIGQRVIIHSGAVIGADGFGYQTVNGKHIKIPQIGIVRIEDDVEIGANTTIDRARLHETVVGAGTKIDNLVQIGHNVLIGKNCLILSQVGISGSCVIEDNVILAGQAGMAGHITVGKGAMIAAQSGLMRDVEPGAKMFGSPAKPHILTKRIDICLDHLPETAAHVKDILQRIEQLQAEINSLKEGRGSG